MAHSALRFKKPVTKSSCRTILASKLDQQPNQTLKTVNKSSSPIVVDVIRPSSAQHGTLQFHISECLLLVGILEAERPVQHFSLLH